MAPTKLEAPQNEAPTYKGGGVLEGIMTGLQVQQTQAGIKETDARTNMIGKQIEEIQARIDKMNQDYDYNAMTLDDRVASVHSELERIDLNNANRELDNQLLQFRVDNAEYEKTRLIIENDLKSTSLQVAEKELIIKGVALEVARIELQNKQTEQTYYSDRDVPVGSPLRPIDTRPTSVISGLRTVEKWIVDLANDVLEWSSGKPMENRVTRLFPWRK
jgi:hypothetical protein